MLSFPPSQVMEGRGVMLVTAVGPSSQQGMIFELMSQQEEEVGFITQCFRNVRDRISGRVYGTDIESGEGRSEEDDKKDIQVTVGPCVFFVSLLTLDHPEWNKSS